jgi:hypothetical protein
VSGKILKALAAAALSMQLACSGAVTSEIAAGIDACQNCNMVVDELHQAGGYVISGEFVPFDSPACLLQSYDALRREGKPLPEAIFLADYKDTSLHPAKDVTFLLTSHVPTVMNSGVICFGSLAAAESMRRFDDERLTDWLGYRTARGEPDRVLAVTFGPEGMSPETVEVSKGELVLWRARSLGLGQDLSFTVKGYPEMEPLVLPASGEVVAFRLLAVRPGTGFPVVRQDDGETLGILKVTGAHTAEEEVM